MTNAGDNKYSTGPKSSEFYGIPLDFAIDSANFPYVTATDGAFDVFGTGKPFPSFSIGWFSYLPSNVVGGWLGVNWGLVTSAPPWSWGSPQIKAFNFVQNN